jgi:chemotaxis protein methyltransferase CheR
MLDTAPAPALSRSSDGARGALNASDIRLSPEVFKKIQALMYRRFGIALGDHKRDLVVSRLADRLRQRGLGSYEEYLRLVMKDESGDELSAMVDSLTTNHTSLYREPEHFDYLAQAVLPQLKNQTSISIWSAGCATGEEPYSIACWLMEKLGSLRPETAILATDISGRALRAAQQGVYGEDRFGGLPEAWRRKFLLRGEGRRQGLYRFKPEVQKLVRFKYLNLNEPFAGVGHFDIIFCRNVMIYFDQPTRERLLSKLAKQLSPGGYFLPGHAESLSPELHGMKRVHPAVYRKA